ncbi:tyrosine-type recombinase/integrase [Pararhodospirillum oryzae]|uniref:Integrase n=1 Tax=Pararhodospirillum oryzae TaxID=478448 RepID=A0A512H916_9PROT|nr:site-specific integrase [Pararhodospirillum oryzae]GEO81944.1 integrase [Pararhodospirillum oryzae]
MASEVNIPHLRRKTSGWYWEPSRRLRALGFSSEPLGKDQKKAIDRAMDLNKAVDASFQDQRTASPPAGTVARMILDFQTSDRYKSLSDLTRRDYDRYLRVVEEVLGKVAAGSLTRKVVKAFQAGVEANYKPSVAASLLRTFSALCGYIYDQGYFKEHPARNLRIKPAAERDQVWTEENIAALTDAALGAGRPSVALAVHLGFWLGQRQGDILSLPWSAYDANARTCEIRQSKTGTRLVVPVFPELAALLDSTPRRSPVIVVNEGTGRPYTMEPFSKLFRKVAKTAGLPTDLQFRDLRRTAATRLGEAGCSDDEIRAITGHKSRSVVARYVRPNSIMAESAMNRLGQYLSGTLTESPSENRRKKDLG